MSEAQKSIEQQIMEMAIDLVKDGKVVKLIRCGETIGFMMSQGFFPGDVKFTLAGIPVYISEVQFK